ncbi:NADPH-dependent FMN reductase [Streptomyces sp. NPDC101160]|uniref:NADPH-dependent FMN reductase n=1 Tax=Streptomyces sp. NPDC101160 TaxID=3366118 RepID=UPI00382B0D3B
MSEVNLLSLSGSSRKVSYNTALLLAAQQPAPAGTAIRLLYGELRAPPLVDQDLDTASPPTSVLDLRRSIAKADALLTATPEHNTLTPAALKNAIDWAGTGPNAVFDRQADRHRRRPSRSPSGPPAPSWDCARSLARSAPTSSSSPRWPSSVATSDSTRTAPSRTPPPAAAVRAARSPCGQGPQHKASGLQGRPGWAGAGPR